MGTIESTRGQAAALDAASQNQQEMVDRLFACPVCYEKYNSHIIQCQSGHSVCQTCSGRLRQCPQCCSKYVGTRNYTLEDFIGQLQNLNTTPEMAMKDILQGAEARAIAKSAKEAEEREAFIRSFNTFREQFSQAMQSSQSSSNRDEIVCRMQNCRRVMALTELKEHLNERHKQEVKILTAKPYLSKSFFSFDLYCANHRYALMTEFGIFFLILRVEKQPYRMFKHDLFVTAWVQGTCKEEEAHLFYFRIQIEMKHTKATYHDYVHGSRATVANIEENSNCLRFTVRGDTYDDLKIYGYVCLNKFSNSVRPRREETEVEIIPTNRHYSSDSD